ncbi:MAG: phosphatase PAP2 family protein [Spirochaetia bacterium]|nr:MAG: phosphatase PAP2 family protein [Spirochaetia bacterium]
MDVLIFQFINGFASRWWLLDWLGIFLANYASYFLVLLAVYFLFKEKSRVRRIYFFSLASLSVILSRGIITELIRFFYNRQRPFEVFHLQTLISQDPGGSLPSGHSTAFFALFLTLYYFAKQNNWNLKPVWWSLGIVLVMGIARIFVGVHWPSDILAGAVIGLLSALIIKKILPEPKSSDLATG